MRYFELAAELEQLLQDVCNEQGVPERRHDELRMLLQQPSSEWPACCRGSCEPCVDEQTAIAREVLRRASG
jgi:hypothetical protein